MKILYRIILVFILIVSACILTLYNPVGRIVYFRLAVLFYILFESAQLFKELIINKTQKDWLKNLATMSFSFFTFLLLLEAIFMFIPRSHGVGFTLAHKLFYKKYYQLNSLGFRDREPETDKDSAILFVGDSFTEGWGIKDVNDRYSDIFRSKIENRYKNHCITNIGLAGLASTKEYKTLINFINKTQKKPSKIYLQYFGNDIFDISDSMLPLHGYRNYHNVPPNLIPVLHSSYLINFIYWSIPQKNIIKYNDHMMKVYNDTACFRLHTLELNRFINYSKQNNIELTVIIFPFLTDLELSKKIFTNRIKEYFKQNRIKTIDVSGIVSNLKMSERITNINDHHASVKVHHLVADELIKQLKK